MSVAVVAAVVTVAMVMMTTSVTAAFHDECSHCEEGA